MVMSGTRTCSAGWDTRPGRGFTQAKLLQDIVDVSHLVCGEGRLGGHPGRELRNGGRGALDRLVLHHRPAVRALVPVAQRDRVGGLDSAQQPLRVEHYQS